MLYLSLGSDQTVGSLSVANEDIVAWHGGSTFSTIFDGSDVGLASLTLDAFTVIGPDEILMSFTDAATFPNLGTVDDSDILLFTATSLGETTAGSFSVFFDGSDMGLAVASEDIDAIEYLTDAAAPLGYRLLLSTSGNFGAQGLSGNDEDIFVFTPTTSGANSTGALAMYFDGSDVGLTSFRSENLDGVSRDVEGNLYFSTAGDFAVSGLSGADEDVFRCNSPVTGPASACSSWSMFFDGSPSGLGSNDVFAIDLP